ncbi:hypothetical protein CD351_10785 [Erythrobacter sp. KY5]|nr:hypothetical protein CD351_10785 [Erythrobacter sp. KY5]
MPEVDMVDCAIGTGADYSKECVLEKLGPRQFVIHGPNGGFRRFEVQQNDQGVSVISIDGAAPVAVISDDSPLEFAVEDDVYRVDPALITAPQYE